MKFFTCRATVQGYTAEAELEVQINGELINFLFAFADVKQFYLVMNFTYLITFDPPIYLIKRGISIYCYFILFIDHQILVKNSSENLYKNVPKAA